MKSRFSAEIGSPVGTSQPDQEPRQEIYFNLSAGSTGIDLHARKSNGKTWRGLSNGASHLSTPRLTFPHLYFPPFCY